jgi:hypothetical protein
MQLEKLKLNPLTDRENGGYSDEISDINSEMKRQQRTQRAQHGKRGTLK